ncbi:PulJ/GspJ family protein [Agarivorans sp. QJM3NY_33]|uniref:PulJ/GspJ family protein n=1 Tax=Agarivorans sp. QJM3NY_33 TaxID=3421432 RepID=UPI003D7ECD7D
MKRPSGFTLIELVLTMVLLAILAIASSDFIRTGSLIYRQGADRQVLLGEARFALQRLSRELHNSLPNSARLDPNKNNQADYCLSFVPTLSSHTYIDLPIAPNSAVSASVVTSPSQPVVTAQGNAWASVYVLSSNEVLNGAGQLLDVSCDLETGKVFCLNSMSADAGSGLSTLNFANPVSFASGSPAQRLFILSEPVRYCVEGSNLIRYQPASATNGVLMASKLQMPSSVQPFRVVEPSLTRNGLVNLRLAFVENNEVVEFNHDIVVLNQP